MRIFTNTQFLVLAFSIVVGLFIFLLVGRPSPSAQPITTSTPNVTSAKFLEEAETRRLEAMEEKAKEERAAKLKTEKANSVECKFWKQQKKAQTSARVDEKISEFCELASATSSNAATLGQANTPPQAL